jgi:hypothetical protein
MLFIAVDWILFVGYGFRADRPLWLEFNGLRRFSRTWLA